MSSILLSKNTKAKIFRTVILYGYQTWSLTFMDEPRLMVFGNRVLRNIFLPTGDEVTGE